MMSRLYDCLTLQNESIIAKRYVWAYIHDEFIPGKSMQNVSELPTFCVWKPLTKQLHHTMDWLSVDFMSIL